MMGALIKGIKTMKEIEAGETTSGKSKTLSEHGNSKGVEKVSDSDFERSAKLEEFMNQILTVIVAKNGTPGSYDVITPNVNGVNQPIILGSEQKIKRKYVESLARSRITNYEQDVPDPRKPENFVMRDITALTYPFSVIHDPHPRGREWLQSILDQP